MKRLFDRSSSSRSSARTRSGESGRITVCRTSLLALLVAGLILLLARGAMAQPLPYDTGSTDTSSWFGTWNSTINCTVTGPSTNVIDLNSLTQSAVVSCFVTPNGGPPGPAGVCQLNISYTRPAGLTATGVTQCQQNPTAGTSTLTDVAFCGSNGLVVSGTLNCNPQNLSSPPAICTNNNPCIANLDGISAVPNGQCGTVFPATPDLAAGQVLQASVIGAASPTCNGKVVSLGNILTRFCDSGSFNLADPSRCVFGTGSSKQTAAITGTTVSFLPVNIAVSPSTVNTSCSPNKDQGAVTFTIFGSTQVDVTLINQSNLQLEGVQVPPGGCSSPADVNGDGFPDLTCKVPSCPTLGQNLANAELPNKTADITVTGALLNSGTAIAGDTIVKLSP
jgi:hypothetical protein